MNPRSCPHVPATSVPTLFASHGDLCLKRKAFYSPSLPGAKMVELPARPSPVVGTRSILKSSRFPHMMRPAAPPTLPCHVRLQPSTVGRRQPRPLARTCGFYSNPSGHYRANSNSLGRESSRRHTPCPFDWPRAPFAPHARSNFSANDSAFTPNRLQPANAKSPTRSARRSSLRYSPTGRRQQDREVLASH